MKLMAQEYLNEHSEELLAMCHSQDMLDGFLECEQLFGRIAGYELGDPIVIYFDSEILEFYSDGSANIDLFI